VLTRSPGAFTGSITLAICQYLPSLCHNLYNYGKQRLKQDLLQLY